jgi:hypothetical protein
VASIWQSEKKFILIDQNVLFLTHGLISKIKAFFAFTLEWDDSYLGSMG